MSSLQDFRNNVKPNWCPGCGDYASTSCFTASGGETGAGTTPTYYRLWHWLQRSAFRLCLCVWHAYNSWQSVAFCQGLKLANPELTVIACGGDGDGMAIGLGHTYHAIRRNVNITYILMDNHVYGLTKGQTSPRSDWGFKPRQHRRVTLRRLLRLWKWPYLREQVL